MGALRMDIRGPHVERPESLEDVVPEFRREPVKPIAPETQAELDLMRKPVRLM